MNALRATGISALFCLCTAQAWGGPHAGGVVVLHANESLVYKDGLAYCGQSGLGDCNDADVRVDDTATRILYVFAAFPAESSPRLAGVVFGQEHDEDRVEIVDWDHCGDLVLYSGTQDGRDWPASGSVVAVTWEAAQTEHLVEVLWLAARSEPEDAPALIELVSSWIGGGAFGDDSVPSIVDPIADYGRLGFFQDGYLPCPDPPTPVQSSSWGTVKALYR